jgi:hypothetical protein
VPAALVGTAVIDGGGSQAPERAERIVRLGYPTVVFHDADLTRAADHASYNTRLAAAEKAGAVSLTWARGLATEDQIALTLPLPELATVLALAAELNTTDDPESSIRASVENRMPQSIVLSGMDPFAWVAAASGDEIAVRTAIGSASREVGWFKSETGGEMLGDLVVGAIEGVPASNRLRSTLERLREFAYGRPDAVEPVA